ncbi:MAG: PP2C family protein-serine/threonine phosphatase [Plesiomonas shigelloides]
MHPFQENIQTWLSRKLANYVRNQCFEIPFVLSTDTGLVRKENQDRVAALYTGKKSKNPLFVIAVADGMGGMRDGGLCSSLAISSFFYSLIQHRNLDIKERAYEAIKASNRQVFESYQGGGGSTLTAVLLDHHGKKIIVHLGDTRVYTFKPNHKVERHTTDDSLVEAVGGIGRELLQFVGMGESMQPNISELINLDGFCAITTDGIHEVEEKTFSRVLENSNNINEASERLNSVAMWCGGHDNATSAIFDLGKISISLSQYEGSGIRLWDAGGDLTTVWLREEESEFNAKQIRNKEKELDADGECLSPFFVQDGYASKEKIKKTKAVVRRSRKKKSEEHLEDIQLDIEIVNTEDKGIVDVDRK